MKIAVTSEGSDLNSETDPRFGRARYFIIVDTERDAYEAVDNVQNLNAAQGAGVQAAQTVADLQVEAVLTGNCGPKAFRVLNAAGIKVFVGAEGTVQSAVEKLKAGRYEAVYGPNVEGHW